MTDSPSGSTPEPRRLRRWIGGALAGIAITIATVLMLEGAASATLFVRDYYAATGPTTEIRPHTEHDTLLGWVNRISSSVPNEFGRGIDFNTTPERFRGRGALTALPPGHSRLVCSGDSFTMGSGVGDDDTWTGCATLPPMAELAARFDKHLIRQCGWRCIAARQAAIGLAGENRPWQAVRALAIAFRAAPAECRRRTGHVASRSAA